MQVFGFLWNEFWYFAEAWLPSWDAAWLNCPLFHCNLNAASSLVQVERRRKDKQQNANTLMSIKLSLFSSSNEKKEKNFPPSWKNNLTNQRSEWTVRFSVEAADCVCATNNSTSHWEQEGFQWLLIIESEHTDQTKRYNVKKVCITTNTNKETSREEQMGWLWESEISGETNRSCWRDWSRGDDTDSAWRAENL